MKPQQWHRLRMPGAGSDSAWEVFHENSKSSRFDAPTPEGQLPIWLSGLLESLSFEGHPQIELPAARAQLDLSLTGAIEMRRSSRAFAPEPVSMEALSTLLHYGYGPAEEDQAENSGRALRLVPSAGSLYPLEIFIHPTRVEGLSSGIYHYHPLRHTLSRLRTGDHSGEIASALLQPELGVFSAVLIFLTAVFERTTLKYGERGYRYVLLESGHVAQNINLVAAGLDLKTVNIGGYLDRQIDELLDLDGCSHSTIYMLAVGKEAGATGPG